MYSQKELYSFFGIFLLIAHLLFSYGCNILDSEGGSEPIDEKILFIKYDKTISEICSINPDGTDFQIVASNDYASDGTHGGYHDAKWSPNKSRIVITVGSKMMDVSPSLWLMDNEGRLLSQLTSADESRIAYISGNYVVGSQIKQMNSDGSGEEVLVDTLARYVTVRWSPDGDKIAFAKMKKLDGYNSYEEGSDIFVLDILSGTVERLTNFAADSVIVYIQDWK